MRNRPVFNAFADLGEQATLLRFFLLLAAVGLICLLFSCSDAHTQTDTPTQPKVGLIVVPVPIHKAKVCWPFKDTGLQVCVAFNADTDTFMVKGTK